MKLSSLPRFKGRDSNTINIVQQLAAYKPLCHLNFTRDLLSEKAMATHSSTLAWKIPWMEEPGRLQSMELLRGGHD